MTAELIVFFHRIISYGKGIRVSMLMFVTPLEVPSTSHIFQDDCATDFCVPPRNL